MPRNLNLMLDLLLFTLPYDVNIADYVAFKKRNQFPLATLKGANWIDSYGTL